MRAPVRARNQGYSGVFASRNHDGRKHFAQGAGLTGPSLYNDWQAQQTPKSLYDQWKGTQETPGVLDQIKAGVGQAIDAVRHPIDTVKGIGESIANDFNTVTSPVQGMPTDVLGNLIHGRPQERVTAQTPGSVTPTEFAKGAGKSAIDLALPMLPAGSVVARAAVGGTIGAISDPEPIRGATAGIILNEGLHQAGSAFAKEPVPVERRIAERPPNTTTWTPEERSRYITDTQKQFAAKINKPWSQWAPEEKDAFFAEQDNVKQVVHQVAGDVATEIKAPKLVDALRRIFAPANRSAGAAETGNIIRANAGDMARSNELAREKLKEFSGVMGKMSSDERLGFIDNMENGEPQANPRLDEAAGHMRKLLDDARETVQSLGTGKLEHFIEDYFPHIWEKPGEAQSIMGQIMGRRPLEGSKSFLKERSIPTTAEGIAMGLKPLTDNPVDLTLLKLREMNRYILGQRIIAEMKDQGLVKFVKATDRPPTGYTKINDKVATVFAPTTDEGAMAIRGYYHGPEAVATVLNNHLSPGLRGNPLVDGYMAVGNVMNQAQLGFSAYHLGMTSLDASVSKMALGFEQLGAGKVKGAVKSFAAAPVAPVANYLRGSKVLNEYLRPGASGGEMADVVDGLTQGGGRVRMDQVYKNNAIDKMTTLLREEGTDFTRPFKAGMHLIPAALEMAAKPIMEHIVPRQKLGVFADLARFELEKLPPGAPQAEVRAAMARVWDSVDNRMGQLVYDNLFWDRTFKDLAMSSVRSVGWNLGTARELGGGVIDAALAPRRVAKGGPLLTHKLAYTVALPITVGMYGAVMQYLYTGKGPEELQDYFHPKTGRKNENGDDERVQLPSYMKDVIAYSRHPVETVKHKKAPLLSMIAEMLDNKDYYGDMIRNPDDPGQKQVAQEAAYLFKNIQPFGIQNIREQRLREQSLATQLGSLVGVTPAAREDVRSEAENKMAEFLGQGMPAGGTPEDADKRDVRREIHRLVRQGQAPSPKVLDAIKTGVITIEDAERAAKDARTPALVDSFKRLSYEQALEVFKLGNPQEQSLWLPVLVKKHANYAQDHPETFYAAR